MPLPVPVKTRTTKCLILAAGLGSRLAARGGSKPLVALLGLPLIERAILTARKAGLDDFYVVTGHKGEEVRDFLDSLSTRRDIRISYIENEEWESAGNGLSVLKAKGHLDERFVLMMADHLFDEQILNGLLQTSLKEDEICLAVDENLENPLVDLDDVTRVRVHDGHIADIAKEIDDYNAFDTGLFLCTRAIFAGLEESMSEHDDSSLSGGIQILALQQKARTFNIGDSFWIDVDDESTFERAERHLLSRLSKNRDGPVSRYINRPVSVRITRHLVNATNISPNLISFFSFICCAVAALLFSRPGYLPLAFGGLLAQFASIVDGCDGEVARLKSMESDFGGWFDAVLDRYADAFLLLGLLWHVYMPNPSSFVLLVGFLAIIGSFMNSYTADKYDGLMKTKFEKGREIRIGRDVRIGVVSVGAVLNIPLLVLFLVAILMNAETIRRIFVAYRHA